MSARGSTAHEENTGKISEEIEIISLFMLKKCFKMNSSEALDCA